MSNLATKETTAQNVNYAPTSVIGLIPDTPYNRITNFINEYDSKSTRGRYTRDYGRMFQYMCGKQFGQLTYEDIKQINKDKVKAYRQFLKQQYKETTINQMILAIKTLWDHFISENITDKNPFDFSKKERLQEHENCYGSLTLDEMKNLFNFCLERTYKPRSQQLYFEFLFVVTCRKHVAQTLTWNKIKRRLDVETKQMVWVIDFVEDNADKGTDSRKSITDEFYNRLKENYESEGCTNNKVFCGIYNGTYDDTLKAFCERYNIPPERKIKQHSIKSSGLEFIQDILGDPNITAQAAEHKHIQTTYRRYLNKNKRFTKQPSFMLHKNFSIDMLEGLGEDVLLDLIKKAGMETVVKLCLELEKMTESK